MPEAKLLIFCKQFTLGHVKTRLAKTVGDTKALDIYKELCRLSLENTSSPDLERIIYYDQSPARANEIWQKDQDLRYKIQPPGDLGLRMLSAFKQECSVNKPTILIGTDCPEINQDHIYKTIALLETSDVVLGPTLDGGYYLIAVNTPHETLFTEMKWSTEQVLSDTIQRCKENNISYAMLDQLSDIDYEADWINYQSRRTSNNK